MNKKHRCIIQQHISPDQTWLGATDSDQNPVVTLDGETHHVLKLLFDLDPTQCVCVGDDRLSLDPQHWQPISDEPEVSHAGLE